MSLEVASITLWTDSTIVLHMIRNMSARFETFVANRLAVIHELSEPDDWVYVDSKPNPTDLASRGMKPETSLNRLWFEGPLFLKGDRSEWPPQPRSIPAINEFMKTKEKACVNLTTTPVVRIDWFKDVKHWFALLRRIAWLIRFCQWLRWKQNRREKSTSLWLTRFDENSTTVLAEAERIPNSRPLTKLSDDPDDLSATTPNHLFLLRANNSAKENDQCKTPCGLRGGV